MAGDSVTERLTAPSTHRGRGKGNGGRRPFAIYHEMNDCRWYAADQKAKLTMMTASEIGPRISAPNPLGLALDRWRFRILDLDPM